MVVHEIRVKEHLSVQNKNFLTLIKINLTLELYCNIRAWFGLMSDQSTNCANQHQKCSENVRCLTVIACYAIVT